MLALSLAVVSPVTHAATTYTFAVPPRQSRAAVEQMFGPVAQYLSHVTGAHIHLKYESNWLSYETDMQKGLFDLVFDGPAFVSWRMVHQSFRPLVGLSGHLTFVIVTRANSTLRKPAQLIGQTVCAFSPPNIATLTLYSLFPNPMQQPAVINVQGLKTPYMDVVNGRCKASITMKVLYDKLNQGPTAGKTRILWTATPIPNQAFSAGPRIPRAMQERIKEALLSTDGMQATARMRAAFGNRPLVPVEASEFTGLDQLLRGIWGFSGSGSANP